MIFTSLSPNTETDDVMNATSLLLQPWKWKNGTAVLDLENAFKKYFGVEHAYAFQSGRNSLYALLQTLHLSKDDEILLQAYTCVAVPEPVLWVGARPIYVDILPNLTMDPEDLRKKITPKSKVLIIQHTFGNAANITNLMHIAQENNLFVIEDCAHAMGVELEGKKLGTFGDAGFFSFGRDKMISSVFGGMLILKNSDLAEKVNVVRDQFKTPSYFYVQQQLLHPAVLTLSKKVYNFLSLGKIILSISLKMRIISKAVETPELRGQKPSFVNLKMPNALALLALHQFKKLDRFNKHRRAMCNLYSNNLKDIESVPAPLRYTIFINNSHELVALAKKEKIELGNWYQQAIAPATVDYQSICYNPLTTPKAELYASRSVNLPTHIGITEKEAQTIITFIKKNAR